jgi:hypothetical protein
MDVCKYSLDEIIIRDIPVIGFSGSPTLATIHKAARKFPRAPFFNLDRNFNAPLSELLVTDTCPLVRNFVDNTIALANQLLCVVATGSERCEAGRFAAMVLAEQLDIPVFISDYHRSAAEKQPLLCEARGPLASRIPRIMSLGVDPLSEQERNSAFIARCEPSIGLWGMPVYQEDLLSCFPQSTHIFGWLRCVELGTPADTEAEAAVPENLPTVFFAQQGCARAILAHSLARKHNGLFISIGQAPTAEQINTIKVFVGSLRTSLSPPPSDPSDR